MGGSDLHCCYREQIAFSFYSKFREPRLYRAAGRVEEWDSIAARCTSHPAEAAFVHKFAPNDTPLHRLFRVVQCHVPGPTETTASIHKRQLTAVSALLAANRQAANRQDGFLRTPLHLACMDVSLVDDDDTENATESGGAAALMILLHNPVGARLTDVELRTPLHFLVARNDQVPLLLLQALIEHSPASVHMQDAVGETPVDIVQRRQDEITNAKEILILFSNVAAVLPPAVTSERVLHNNQGRQRSASSNKSL